MAQSKGYLQGPWLPSVEINLSNLQTGKVLIEDLGSKIEGDELLISWVKSKARG